MPYTDAQVRLFAAKAPGAKLRKDIKLSKHDAEKMLSEAPKSQRSRAMKRRPRSAKLSRMTKHPAVRHHAMGG